MKIIEPYHEIIDNIDGESLLKKIELMGRTAYKSENTISDNSYLKFIKLIISKKHYSVIEHVSISVKVVCDRAISHEIVRHRIASYTQESTRYCNYSNDKFSNEITVIKPIELSIAEEKIWKKAMEFCENSYFKLLHIGCSPQMARSVLPNSLKTEINITMNLREWIHFFELRTSPAAHPQIRFISKNILRDFKSKIPIIFDEI